MRLPWQHYTGIKPGAFIAYPDGSEDRFAMIWPDPSLPKDVGQWRWTVTIRGEPGIPKANRNGTAMTKQEAADRATEAWLIVSGR